MNHICPRCGYHDTIDLESLVVPVLAPSIDQQLAAQQARSKVLPASYHRVMKAVKARNHRRKVKKQKQEQVRRDLPNQIAAYDREV